MPLRLNVLGEFRARTAAGVEIPIPGRKVKALLAYLCLAAGQAHSREKLATLLWGDRMDAQARQSLRHALSALRRALGSAAADAIVADGDQLCADADRISVDAWEFERSAQAVALPALEDAAELYRGALLDGLHADCEGFDGWAAGERQRLHELACGLLERLATEQEARGDGDAAIRTHRRLLELDPAREEAHRSLMRLYVRSGQRSAALKQYRTCVEALRRELDAEPAAETRHLYEALRSADAGEPAPDSGAVAAFKQSVALPLPTRPSIAVLSFDVLSDDPEQAYLGDGFSDNLITQLSSLPGLFVIARNSAFMFKGQAVDLREVGRRLGVRSVLEGTIQRQGDRLRVTAQLIDAATGGHLWAERYDRRLDDIFQVQDEVADRIVLALQIELTEDEPGARLMRETTGSVEAWRLVLRALEHFRRMNPEDNRLARGLAEQALAVDADYLTACVLLGWTHHWDARYGFADEPAGALALALELAQRVKAAEPRHGPAYALAGCTLLLQGRHREGMEDLRRALERTPNNADTTALMAMALHHAGSHEEALSRIEAAMRLSPLHADWYLSIKGHILFQLRRYGEVLPVLAEARRRLPLFSNNLLTLIASHAALGQMDAAHAVRADLLRAYPGYRAAERVPQAYPYRRADDLAHLLDNLRKAGLA